MTVPQYAKSTDRGVIDTITANVASAAAFHDAALAFSAKYGDDPKHGYYPNHRGGDRSIAAIASKQKPSEGRWTQGFRGRGWRPFKNTPIAHEMSAIGSHDRPVPGISEAYDGEYNHNGSQRLLFPLVFVHDGVAWFRLSGLPIDEQHSTWGTGEFDHTLWTEVLASQWYAAYEAYTGTAVDA